MKKRRVLIFSDEFDSVTDNVVEWLNYFDEKVLIERINGVKPKSSIQVINNNYNSIWYRRLTLINTPANTSIGRFVIEEFKSNYMASIKVNEANKKLGTIDNLVPNKLDVLSRAYILDIKIPKTILTTSKIDFLEFNKGCEEVIIKCISDPVIILEDGKKKTLYTHLLSEKDIREIPKSFSPSFFQERIKKKYEIRSFFINHVFYSMAIFSANNSKTDVDMRNYDFNNPNRKVCYKLPIELEDKLCKLMSSLNLNTGSIDLIKGVDNQYYFLEVNPVGQFGDLSHTCNYKIEKEIANYLL